MATPSDRPKTPLAVEPASAPFDVPAHYKSGAVGKAGDVTFTLRMLPKLMVSGPVPEIEQLQIDVSRGADHKSLVVDTVKKSADWGGVIFELGYADVYHDDIELTVRKK